MLYKDSLNNYDLWKTDNSEYYETSRPDCRKCEEKDKARDDASEFLEEIVKQLYSQEKLDVNILEHCLDELCYFFDIKANTGDLQIARQQVKKHQKLDLLLAYTDVNQFVNQLTKSQ